MLSNTFPSPVCVESKDILNPIVYLLGFEWYLTRFGTQLGITNPGIQPSIEQVHQKIDSDDGHANYNDGSLE